MNNAGTTPIGSQSRKIRTVGEVQVLGTQFLSRAGSASPRLDAEVLLGLILGWKKEKLYAQGTAPLGVPDQLRYQALLERRAHGEPTAYICGRREFWSLDLQVNPAVLVPRPETETLVAIALAEIEAIKEACTFTDNTHNLRILELGTGSGAIAVSLAMERNDIEIWATDFSAAALEVARSNAERQHVAERFHFLCGDAFAPVSAYKRFFHGIISNPPYVRRGELAGLSREVLWEPRSALDGGIDGLDMYRKIIPYSHLYLQDQGFVALEMGADMGEGLYRWFKGIGCCFEVSVHKDMARRDRVIVARRTVSSGKPPGKD